MAKICPLTNEKVLYLDCQECDEKSNCKNITKGKTPNENNVDKK